MKQNADLYELIKSLSRNEKGYFKKNIPNTEKNYILLFNAIDSQTVYDEKEIKKQLAGHTFLKQFHVAKIYLYKKILNSLKNYNSEKSIESRLRELENEVSLLFEKGLLEHVEKLINKGIILAKKYENFFWLIKFSHWDLTLTAESFYTGISESDLEKLFDERKRAVALLENLFEYDSLNSKTYFYSAQLGKIRSTLEKEKSDHLKKEVLLLGEKNALSGSAKLFYFTSLKSYYYEQNDHKNNYEYAKKCVQTMEEYPFLIKANTYRYIAQLGSLLNAQLDFHKYEDQIEVIDRLKRISTRSENHLLEIDLMIYNNTLQRFFLSGDLSNAEKEIEKIIVFLSENHKLIDPQIKSIFDFNISYVYFCLDDFSKALIWNNKILNSKEAIVRRDVYSMAMIVNLIIHFELGNYDLLSYIILSTYRYFLKKERLFAFEKMVLTFIKKVLSKIEDRKKLVESYSILKDQLIEISKDPYEASILEEFDLISWLDSKIKNKPFNQILKEKNKL